MLSSVNVVGWHTFPKHERPFAGDDGIADLDSAMCLRQMLSTSSAVCDLDTPKPTRHNASELESMLEQRLRGQKLNK